MGKLTQMRSQKSSKAKYKRPKTPAQVAAADAKRVSQAVEDEENAVKGSNHHQPSGLKVKSGLDGKMKVDEMVGKVNKNNAQQFVDDLDKQLKQVTVDSAEELYHKAFMREALSMVRLHAYAPHLYDGATTMSCCSALQSVT